MKKTIFTILTAFLVLAVAACAAPAPVDEGPAVDTSGDVLEICVVHNNADHPSITAIVEGMNDEAAIFNASVTYFDPAFDPQRQASMIEDCIARDPDVIVVNAVDPTAVIAPIQNAVNANIPVITQNADVAAAGQHLTTTFVGSQSYDQGYAVGQMIAGEVDSPAEVVFIGGAPGQTDYVNRVQGAQDAWADMGFEYEVLADQPAEWSKDQALNVMQDLLTRYPDGIDVVFAVDDPMALGALEAIKAAGREGDIAVFGVNGNIEACEAIQAGEMSGTALQMSYLVGVFTVRAAYDVKIGRLVPNQILAPTAPVTQDNIAQWMDSCW